MVLNFTLQATFSECGPWTLNWKEKINMSSTAQVSRMQRKRDVVDVLERMQNCQLAESQNSDLQRSRLIDYSSPCQRNDLTM